MLSTSIFLHLFSSRLPSLACIFQLFFCTNPKSLTEQNLMLSTSIFLHLFSFSLPSLVCIFQLFSVLSRDLLYTSVLFCFVFSILLLVSCIRFFPPLPPFVCLFYCNFFLFSRVISCTLLFWFFSYSPRAVSTIFTLGLIPLLHPLIPYLVLLATDHGRRSQGMHSTEYCEDV